MKQVRSWSKDHSVPRLIGRKKVDWSIFQFGFHIPMEFHIDFEQANDGKIPAIGTSEKLKLYINDRAYEASLININQQADGSSSLQLSYDNNSDLKDLMIKTFKRSYDYITKQRNNNQDSRVQVVIPDDDAEYIEFYATDIPFEYEIKLISKTNTVNVWWVNQGSTLAEEAKEGILWAPLKSRDGRSQYHWDTMDEVQEGDIILHYANGSIRYVSEVIQASEPAEKPSSLGNANEWNNSGRIVKTTYYPINPPIMLETFNKEILELDIHQGPIHSGGGVKQGYLFRFTVEGLQKIQTLSQGVEWPHFSLIDTNEIYNSNESVPGEIPTMNITVGERIKNIKQYIQSKGFVYPEHLIENFYLSLKTKPFVILAGVSGTGKTKLVELFAEALGATEKNGQYKHIPVRPDWSDPADLIGYKDLSGVFRPGPITDVLRTALQPENRNKPYFICLDEMNLARVEHYFSDLLSVMETQKWDGDFIVTQPLIHEYILEKEEDRKRYGDLYFPDNVYLIGTVNMDETTHPFSRKVLDRANTIEFNEINLSLFPNEVQTSVEVIQSENSFLQSDYLKLMDAIGEYRDLVGETTEVLVRINQILEEIHSHVGFRIRDAISFYIIYNHRFELMSQDEAMDFQILQKLLPRIQGSSQATKRVLLRLLEVAMGHSINFSRHMDDASSLYDNQKQLKQAKYPRSAKKLAFMLRRLEEDGFTSYWLS